MGNAKLSSGKHLHWRNAFVTTCYKQLYPDLTNQHEKHVILRVKKEKKTLLIILPVAGAARFKCLSKLMYANQLLDLPFLAVTRNERQEYVIRHSCRTIKAWRWWAIQMREREGASQKSENNCTTHVVDHDSSQVNNSRRGSFAEYWFNAAFMQGGCSPALRTL